jgi:ABC-type Fe3+/spermidine/putrescine transport system ATPase subunit
MREELREIVKTSGMTAVYVTHDQKEALSMADRMAVMDQGRIVQVGAPREIYSRPETRFVADFLGDANFIDGQVVDTGSWVTVCTASGMLQASANKEVDVGASVTCCIRPEQLKIVAGDTTPFSREVTVFHATVLSVVYLGDTYQYHCRLHGNEAILWKVAVFSRDGQLYEKGQTVSILAFPEKVAVIKKQTAESVGGL